MSGCTYPQGYGFREWLEDYITEWIALLDTIICILTLNFYCPNLESKFFHWCLNLRLRRKAR